MLRLPENPGARERFVRTNPRAPEMFFNHAVELEESGDGKGAVSALNEAIMAENYWGTNLALPERRQRRAS